MTLGPIETIAHEGVRWRVRIEGTGPVLLALHGTGSSADSYRGLTRSLGAHFTVVAPDLPGHASSRPLGVLDASLVGMARALNGLLAHLGLVPEVAVGHSAGAAVLARMMLDHRLRPALFVGLAPAIIPLPRAQHLVFSTAARLLRRSTRLQGLALRRNESSVAHLVRGMGSTLDREGLEHYRRLAARPEHLDGVLHMLSAWDVEPVHRELGRLHVRALVVAGAQDRAVPVEHTLRVAERLERGRFVMMPGAGHLLHEERPEEVSDLVVDEWRACTARAPGSKFPTSGGESVCPC
jgi:magnesium chelatase accessory protein